MSGRKLDAKTLLFDAGEGCLLGMSALGVGKLVGKALTSARRIRKGTRLYRVFGNEAKGLGNYYTTVDPASVSNFRETAGLFPQNAGTHVLEGTLNNTEGVIIRTAAPGPGGVGGGLPEVVVPNPASQITIESVSGVNPPF